MTFDAPEAATRGSLLIGARVVEKLAAQAAREVDGATGTRRRVLGQALGEAVEPPRAEARVVGGVAAVTVALGVRWPEPVREVAAAVRGRVRERVETITGLEVAAVDVEVTALPTGDRRARRVR